MWSRFLLKVASCLTLSVAVLLGAVAPAPGQATATDTAKTKTKSTTKAKDEAKPAALLDLNKATAEELAATLPDVGPVTAKKIVDGRPYAKVDDLAKAGVPARTIEAIRGMVTVSHPAPAAKTKAAASTAKEQPKPKVTATTEKDQAKAKAVTTKAIAGKRVNINTASKEELDVLPGIGPVKAQAIIDARPFKTIEDIKNVKGIKDYEFGLIKDIISVR
jgi:competence protein ComEA